MTEKQLEQIIDKCVNRAVSEVVKTLKSGLNLTPPRTNCFKRTEQILYAKNRISKIISEKYEDIEELKTYGLRQKSKSITSYDGSGGFRDTEIDCVVVEDKIKQLRTVIRELEGRLAEIEHALDKIRDNEWYRIIELRYFEGKTIEEIGVICGCDPSTVTRRKNKLVNELKMELFPVESVSELV